MTEFQRHDTNKNGELSEQELGQYIQETLQRNISQLPDVFKEFDKDGNGELNLEGGAVCDVNLFLLNDV